MKREEVKTILPDITDEQLDRLMDLYGTDIEGQKTAITKLQGQLKTARDGLAAFDGVDVEGLKCQVAALKREKADLKAAHQQQLDALAQANALRELRAKVSSATGVPESLLNADTEEACTAQAKAILDFAKPGGYPAVPDGGEPAGKPAGSTREQFAAWFEQAVRNL